MRNALFAAALLATAGIGAALFVPTQEAFASERVAVASVADARALDPATEKVTVRLGGADVLDALITRAPGIVDLHFSNPGNKVDPKALPMLVRLPKLRTLTLTGDMFLFDEEFAALGKLSKLTSLSMHLP